MEGNRKQVGGKKIRFAYEFNKEERRRMVDIFPFSLAFHWEPRTSYTICSSQYTMEYYSAIKKNTFESVLMRWMKLEPIIQSEVSQKEKHQYRILMHTYEI